MLRRSKYGLCIRGYGKKCHREVECMAWGTVPIITNDVCVSSYINPPKEGVHYIRAHDREDMKRKLSGVRPERWKNDTRRRLFRIVRKQCTSIQTLKLESFIPATAR